MSTSKSIRISPETFQRLQAISEPFISVDKAINVLIDSPKSRLCLACITDSIQVGTLELGDFLMVVPTSDCGESYNHV
jgi:hypothetical protein